MKTWKFHHRLLALLVAALVLCASAPDMLHVHAETVPSPDAGEVTPPCEHDGETTYAYNLEGHWLFCLECGEAIGELSAHTYSEDSFCTVCNDRCGHNAARTWTWDDDEHWTICSRCNGVVEVDRGEHTYTSDCCYRCGRPCDHTYEDGVCTTCGTACTHSFTDGECTLCGFVCENHSYNWSGLCSLCGYECPHENTSYETDKWDHWEVCDDCGYTEYEYEGHHVGCESSDTDTCAVCGATGVDVAVRHNVAGSPLNNETHHWWECADCGEKVDYDVHFGNCAEPGVCEWCEGDGYTLGNIEHGDYEYGYDDNYHWMVCLVCDETIPEEDYGDSFSEDLMKDPHIVRCENPTVCIRCGADCSKATEVWVAHDYDYGTCMNCGEVCDHTLEELVIWDANEDGHRLGCRVCGSPVGGREAHYVTCEDPDSRECVVCGGSVGYSDKIVHTGLGKTYVTDVTGHRAVCDDCGETFAKEPHRVLCTSPEAGVCVDCGTACPVSEMTHDTKPADFETYVTDGNQHWYECSGCGEKLQAEDHWAYCDYQYRGGERCEICRAEDVNLVIAHPMYERGWDVAYDEEYHWSVCIACDEAVTAPERHEVSCEEGHENECLSCPATEIVNAVEVHFGDMSIDDETEGDATYHWMICNVCGEREKQLHRADCENPGVCITCGAEYTGDNIRHQIAFSRGDETGHWSFCEICNKKVNVGAHYAYCYEPTFCAYCGYGGNIPVLHTYDPATLAVSGNTHSFTCQICDRTITENHILDENGECFYGCELPAHEHTWVLSFSIPSTCSATGTNHYLCFCDATKQEEVAKKPHTPGAAATCTTAQTCTVCAAVIAPAKGHTEVIDAAVAATCTATGLTEGKHCSVCNAVLTKQEVVAAKGHTEVTDAAVTATCTATGLTEGKHCSVCKTVLTKQEVVPAKGHTEVIDAAVAATCTATGLTEGKHCSVCKTVLTKQEVVAAKGHTEVIDAAVAATCTATGLTEGKHCSVCNEVLTKQETVAALGHTAGAAATCTTAQSCTACAAEIAPALGHTAGDEATCTAAQVCTACSAELAAATGHSLRTVTVGLVTYTICSECDYTESKTSADATATVATVVVNVIENASFEPVVAVADAPALILEVKEQLVYEGLEVALRVFDLALVDAAGEEFAVSSKVRISIPCEGIDLTNLRLVLIQENGDLLEIEYTVENGMLIFETEQLGMFALLPVEA